MTRPIDIAIIIAIKEEFEVVSEMLGLTKSNEVNEGPGQWYDGLIEMPDGKPRQVVVTFIGDMGPVPATRFTTQFLERYTPNLLVNFGLSGSLRSDVKLGDVVVSTLADLYDDAGAIEQIDGRPHLSPSGRPIRTDDFKQHVDHFPSRSPVLWNSWRRECQNEFTRLVAPVKNQIPTKLLSSEPKIHTGHIACGSVVVKSDEWKHALQSRDRKYLAVDMESAAIAYAADDNTAATKTKILVVRVISDAADQRKSDLDKIGEHRGLVRDWALRNGVSFIQAFLPTLTRIDLASVHETALPIVHHLQERQVILLPPTVLNQYLERGPQTLRAYETFFGYFHTGESPHLSFDTILTSIEAGPTGPETISAVTGACGTGKTTLLTLLFLRQLDRFKINQSSYFPIYVNLSYYTQDDGTQHSPSTTINRLRADVTQLFRNAAIEHTKHVMLIVDGCDEYKKHPHQFILDAELKLKLSQLSQSYKIATIVAVGKREESFLAERESEVLAWAKKDVVLTLRRLPCDNSDLPDITAAYVSLSFHQAQPSLSQRMATLIEAYRLYEIDLFLLSLLETSTLHGWDIPASNVASIYYEYCKAKGRPGSVRSIATDYDWREELLELAKEVYEIYINRASYTDSSAQVLSRLPHLHPSIKEFLVAEHVVAQILLGNIMHNNLLGELFPFGINRFVKSGVNRSSDTQRRVLQSITNRYPECSLKQKSHLCFILGRFENRTVREDAIGLLRTYLEQGKTDPLSKSDARNQSFREWLALQRTIYISLIYLGDSKASTEYWKNLLSKPDWDDLNRGFHLEYYEDMERSLTSQHMISFDDVNIQPSKTFNFLFDKLKHDFAKKSIRGMTVIDLHTLLSLCVCRHIVGKLNETMRKKLIALLKMALESNNPDILTSYRPYLDMAARLLDKERVSIGSTVSELLALKTTPRAGWNTEFEHRSERVTRRCPRSESVADHTFGCLLLAEALLPEKSTERNYSKNEIMRMLLIHDLAEAYEGDKIHFFKTEGEIRRENVTMQRISALAALRPFAGARNWRTSWENFKSPTSTNAKIANDVDNIECYVEMLRCLSRDGCQISDADAWAAEVRDGLLSDLGRKLFASLRHETAPLLSWY
jgi:nucleoside phosphorylase/5'-deoxynucleotidase YfbR-like HD superfamily hydrolase